MCVSVSSSRGRAGAASWQQPGRGFPPRFLIWVAQTAGLAGLSFPFLCSFSKIFFFPLKITGRIRPAQLNRELFLVHLLSPVSLGLIACPAEQLLPRGEDAAVRFLLTGNKNMSGTKKKASSSSASEL